MKKQLSALLFFLLFVPHLGSAQQPSFSVSSSTGSFALTCINNTLNLTCTSLSGPPVSYTWLDPHGMSSTMNPYHIIGPGTYTVNATAGGQSSTQTITIADNQLYPVVVAQRQFTVSCPGGTVALKTTEQTNPSAMTFTWSSPAGAITSGNSTPTLVTNTAGFYTIAVTNTVNGCTTHAYFTVWACVGAPEQEGEADLIRLFPNPTAGKLSFEAATVFSTQFKLIVANSLGQLVYVNPCFRLHETADLSFLKTGIYFLALQDERGQKMFRILKE